MIAGSGCVFRYDIDTSSPRPCPNEAGPSFGGYCATHAMKNPNDPSRCLRMIPAGEAGNEAGATDIRCEGSRVPGQAPFCAAHQPS